MVSKPGLVAWRIGRNGSTAYHIVAAADNYVDPVRAGRATESRREGEPAGLESGEHAHPRADVPPVR
jgi:hypothetical protein